MEAGELWLDVWQSVENSSVNPELRLVHKDISQSFEKTSINAELQLVQEEQQELVGMLPITRRRLWGKRCRYQLYCGNDSQQSMELFVKRRRLWDKQSWQRFFFVSAVQNPSPTSDSSEQGHYDTLGVGRSATAAEVRTAYRKKALYSHPDKGGDPALFLRVSAAFEVLGNEASRAAYDLQLDTRGSADGLASASQDSDSKTGGTRCSMEQRVTARLAQVRLLEMPIEAWADALAQLPGRTLEALVAHLTQPKRARGAAVAAQVQEQQPERKRKGDQDFDVKHLRRDKSGYTVKVTWAGLNVSTGYTQSLAIAIDWQIALFRVKDLAQARLGNCSSNGSADPLTLDELAQGLEMAPSLQPTFFFSMKKNGKLVYTPSAPDLRLAIEFWRRYLEILAVDDFSKALANERIMCSKKALEFRQEKRHQERALAKAAQGELKFRSCQGSARRSLAVSAG